MNLDVVSLYCVFGGKMVGLLGSWLFGEWLGWIIYIFWFWETLGAGKLLFVLLCSGTWFFLEFFVKSFLFILYLEQQWLV